MSERVHVFGDMTRLADDAATGALLRTLYDEHYRSMVRLASFYVDDVGSCEEVVQDAFVNLLRTRRRPEAGKEAAYLRSAVLNGARSALRKRRVRRSYTPPAETPVDSPEGAAISSLRTSRIVEALRTLPRNQANVLTLRYFLDLSEADIAETLGMAPGTVKSHAHRGTKRLAVLLEDMR